MVRRNAGRILLPTASTNSVCFTWVFVPSPVHKPKTIPVSLKVKGWCSSKLSQARLSSTAQTGQLPSKLPDDFLPHLFSLASLHRTPRLFIRHPSPNKRTRHLIILLSSSIKRALLPRGPPHFPFSCGMGNWSFFIKASRTRKHPGGRIRRSSSLWAR
ncbi:hypothetical protein CTAM01_07195 [Colletotrichum tamarilloi]|uniref:Uncharacterized protein n=1 Tax=Colletotrichum tamarilloi TaxID=1209934 RepID=A0ABQ9R931_9PEZI|nr:uncharacterized protein CTAM01_07195 [Colletotrichum tamarilloi]KAK1498466.1 hypothetical protein CTAM01_07195 [Colletotrichum tamarilloi]